MIGDPDFSNVEHLTAQDVDSHVEPAPSAVSSPDPAAPPAPPPVIVIEYRRGLLSRLAPPALILAAALAITSYQRTRTLHHFAARPVAIETASTTPPQPKVEEKIQARPINRSDVVAAEKKSEEKPAEPKVPVVAEIPPAVSPPTPPKEEKRAPSPFELDPSDGLHPLNPATPPNATSSSNEVIVPTPPAIPTPDPAPTPPVNSGPTPGAVAQPDGKPVEKDEPEVSKEDILRDIQREADAIEAGKAGRDQLRPQAQMQLLKDALERIESSRIPFRNDLRALLKSKGKNSGPDIDRLCDQYGRETPKEVSRAYQQARRTFPRNLNGQGEIERMRMIGIPEPVLFDFLAHKEDRMRNTRNGPRDEQEVRVRAASKLLSFPVAVGKAATPSSKP